MSLKIDTDRVSKVLLADGWHEVEIGSFDIDAYEFVWGRDGIVSICPQERNVGYTGATWVCPNQKRHFAPLIAILCVQYADDRWS